MDWEAAAGLGRVQTPDDLKRALPLAWVAEQLGIELQPTGPGRWEGTCPFHDDSAPSFDVYEADDTGAERWGCFPCGVNGDLFDLVQRVRGCGWVAAHTYCLDLLQCVPDDWTAEAHDLPVDMPTDIHAYAYDAWLRQTTLVLPPTFVKRLVKSKGWAFPVEWLGAHWQVGVTEHDDTMVIPHLAPSDGGWRATGAKMRTYDRKWSLYGSKFNELYGAKQDQLAREVLLCEGESDCWTASWLLQQENLDVLAVPTGARARPRGEQLARLEGRLVSICFDGDTAGRLGAKAWAGQLRLSRIVDLPDGDDVTSMGTRLLEVL